MADGKWITGLSPEMPVADAARRVLTERFAVVREFLPLAATRAWEGAEFVHQLRVGTRRSGAALRVFDDAFPRKRLKATKQALRTLRQAAGEARDWDVFLAALPETKVLTHAANKPALDFLAGYALGQRAAAQTHLVTAEADTGAAFRELSETLPQRAREPDAEDSPANLGALAVHQLGALLRELTAEAEANPTDPADLHALRITAKRLRYAIELFADCFLPPLKETVYPEVERVQELLGVVQDASVGLARLTDLRAKLGTVLPRQSGRVKKGLDAFANELSEKVPAGRQAFAEWRTDWLKLVAGLKLELLAAVSS